MTLNYRPQSFGGGGSGAESGLNLGSEVGLTGAGEISSGVESQLLGQGDITAAHQFFQTSPGVDLGAQLHIVGGGAESAAFASHAVVGATGAESTIMSSLTQAGLGAAAGAEAAISPVIQLIMRLPGLGGVAQSFFEFLGALFGGNLLDAISQIGQHLQVSLSQLSTQIFSPEHFQIPFNLLPAQLQLFQNLGVNFSFNSLNKFMDFNSIPGLDSISNQTLSSSSHAETFNISSNLDLKKPQFETAASNGFKIDAKLSGPELNPDFTSHHLAGNDRLFGEFGSKNSQSLFAQANTQQTNTIVSNTYTPSGNSSLNSYANDPNALSKITQKFEGPSQNISHNTESWQIAPKNNEINALAKQDILASSSDVPNYNPSMGGYFKQGSIPDVRTDVPSTHTAPAGGIAQPGRPMLELKAEPMSLLKKVNPANQAKPVMDHIGHQTRGLNHHSSSHSSTHSSTAKNTNTHYNEGNKATTDSNAAPHSTPKADQAHKSPEVSKSHHIEKAHQPTNHHAKPGHTEHAKAPKQEIKHLSKQKLNVEVTKPNHNIEQFQTKDVQQQQQQQIDTPQEAQPVEIQENYSNLGNSSYRVIRGDNLWNIAKNRLGDGARWHEIYNLNKDVIGNNPHMMQNGIELKMPGGTDSIHTVSDASQITVQPGDNLWHLASKHLGDGSRWGEIYRANADIIGGNPALIRPGQILQIPGANHITGQVPLAEPNSLNSNALPTAESSSGAMPMQSQAMPEYNQNLFPAQQQNMIPQTAAPQQLAPQQLQSYMNTPTPQAHHIASASNNIHSQVHNMTMGPGAAGAANLDPTQIPNNQVVSSSLAPDLSFLKKQDL